MFGDIILWLRYHWTKSTVRTWLRQNILCIHNYEFQSQAQFREAPHYECTKCGRRKDRDKMRKIWE